MPRTAGPLSGSTARRLRLGLLVLISLLYVVSVPWYRDAGAEVSLVFGLPDWVAVALGCYVAVALLNCVAWLLTDVRDDASDETGPSQAPRP